MNYPVTNQEYAALARKTKRIKIWTIVSVVWAIASVMIITVFENYLNTFPLWLRLGFPIVSICVVVAYMALQTNYEVSVNAYWFTQKRDEKEYQEYIKRVATLDSLPVDNYTDAAANAIRTIDRGIAQYLIVRWSRGFLTNLPSAGDISYWQMVEANHQLNEQLGWAGLQLAKRRMGLQKIWNEA